ncbi:MAG: D-alanine--D-alanine ligase [Desulfococcus multivorans]|jgi:D-alanine-D-alanine ligase|uniref:D-alanine--D-alanine ligase family protein n=1 Tax=Desulfococcus sp. TaxID=2025834 RepID=UPI002A3A26B1|nr:D-alanine--D-alanine ligase [Desulfococcus multivorans]
MKKLTIALLSGGISSERDVSLKSGNQVFEALDKDKYTVLRYDPKTDLQKLMADAPAIDAALIILHGPYGEDGTVQGMLDLLHIPYQGAGVLGSALAMNKLAAKRLYEKAGLRVAPYACLGAGDAIDVDACIEQLGLPLVIKPVSGGSSIGMSIVKSRDALSAAIEKAFRYDRTVMVEAFIKGLEITVGVIGNDRLESFPPIEILPGDGYEFFDYEAKYTAGATQEICPARIDEALTQKVQHCARIAHEALFLRGYSRTDFILKDGEFYVLETNTIPGMTPTSLLPRAAEAAGLSFSLLLDRLVALSIEDHQHRITA